MNKLAIRPVEQAEIETTIHGAQTPSWSWLPDEAPLAMPVQSLSAPDAVAATALAGEPITAKLSHAPGNGAAIGGLKVQTEHAWFAARPSGTEDVYKLYAESLRGPEHLAEVQAEARAVVAEALGGA